ncbi:MAG: PAS domain S-box protein [Pseudomonadota bacterium]
MTQNGKELLEKIGLQQRRITELELENARHKETEEELKESSNRYRERYIALFVSNPYGVLITDILSKMIYFANPAICAMLGYTETELMNMGVTDIHPKESLGVVYEAFTKFISGAEEHSSNLPCLTKNGKVIYVNISGRMITLDKRQYAARFFRDVTETEERLSLFQKAVDNATDAIGMSTPEGRQYYQNEAFTELFGLSVDKVDGTAGPPSTVYADEKAGRKVFDTIMRGGRFSGKVKILDKERNKRDIFLRAYSIKDKEGRVVGLVGIHTDLSKPKNLEKISRLLESE